MYAFLYRNNLQLEVDEMDAAEKIESLAAGPLDETELTDWLRANTKQIT